MSDETNAITVWTPSDVVTIPPTAESVDAIVEFGKATLSRRDMNSIVAGFQAQGYEMVSTFVWTKAADDILPRATRKPTSDAGH